MRQFKAILSKRIVYVCITIILIFIVIIGCAYLAQKDNKKYDIKNIEDKWDIKFNDTEKEDVNLLECDTYNIQEGTTVIATKKLNLKDKEIMYPCLDLKTSGCLVDIYINNKKVDGNYYSKDKQNKSVKRNFLINLPHNYRTATIKLKLYIMQEDMGSMLESICVMSKNDYFLNQLRSNTAKYMCASVTITLVIIMITLAVLIKKSRTNRLFWLAIIFIFSGIGLCAKYDILELFIRNYEFIDNIENISLYICIMSALLMWRNSIKDKKIGIIDIYSTVLWIGFVCIILFKNIGVITYQQIQTPLSIIIYITIIILFFVSTLEYKEKDVCEKIFTIGMLICYIECVIVLTCNSIMKNAIWNKNSKYFIIGLIGTFSLVVLIYYVYLVNTVMEKITQEHMLENLAYTDALTNLSNRTRYQEILEQLKIKKMENLTVISFDLNNLKKINDEYGHDAGDKYIVTFANTLEKIWTGHLFVGRIGGDEFVVFSDNKLSEVKKSIEKTNQVFVQACEKEQYQSQYSFAYGYANSKEDDENNIDILIEKSDNRMYSYKEKQKKSLI